MVNKADRKGVEAAVMTLKKGGSVVYPTDTAYGLGVDATNAKAVLRLYKIKERASRQPIHVIVHNSSAVKKFAIVSRAAAVLMKKHWPGPLSIVLPLRPRAKKSIKMLSAGTGTVGFRVPDNKIALVLASKLGRPITTTSANPNAYKSGGFTPYSVEKSKKQFIEKKHQPDLYLDSGKLRKQKVSTMVKVVRDAITVLRQGPIKVKIK